MLRSIPARGLLLAWLVSCAWAARAAPVPLDGRALMQTVHDRHDIYPYSYEEQTYVLTDRDGWQTVRKARRYWRMEDDGVFHFLLVFHQPPEIYGVAMLARYGGPGDTDGGVYLPAFGAVLKRGEGVDSDMAVMGTDFSVADLSPEDLDANRYVRADDIMVEGEVYHIVDAYARDAVATEDVGIARRRHFIRRANMFIERTDYFDRNGRLTKRLTRHDIRPIRGSGWQAGMVRMENVREQHASLLKVERRVYSEDYVPDSLFHESTLFGNLHLGDPATWSGRGEIVR